MAVRIVALIKAVPDLANLSTSQSQQMVFERSDAVLASVSEEVLEFCAQIKSQTPDVQWSALMLGEKKHENLLKRAFLFGPDEAVLISCPGFPACDHFTKAKLLAAYLQKNHPGPVLVVGASASENTGGGSQTGPRVAAELGWEHVRSVQSVRLEGQGAVLGINSNGTALECSATLPLLALLQKGTVIPRIPNALQVMKVASKTVREVSAASLGYDQPEKGNVVRITRRMLIEHE